MDKDVFDTKMLKGTMDLEVYAKWSFVGKGIARITSDVRDYLHAI